MKRRTLLKGLASLAGAERLLALNAAWAAGNKPLTPGLNEFSGKVTVNGKAAARGMPIQAGDTIITGPEGHAIYVIGQDAYLQRGDSTIQIAETDARNGLRVLTGKLLAVFGKGEKKIQLPTATIGIRGTGCYIETESGRDYFCLCYGIADITPGEAPEKSKTIQTSYHDRPLYLQADGDNMMVPATVKNHTDAELTLLESLVGRYPPFYGKSGSGYSY